MRAGHAIRALAQWTVLVIAIIATSASPDPESSSAGTLRAEGDRAFTSGNHGEVRAAANAAMRRRVRDACMQSLRYFTEAIKKEPENAENYIKRFRVFHRMQDSRRALADLNAALRADANHQSVRVATL